MISDLPFGGLQRFKNGYNLLKLEVGAFSPSEKRWDMKRRIQNHISEFSVAKTNPISAILPFVINTGLSTHRKGKALAKTRSRSVSWPADHKIWTVGHLVVGRPPVAISGQFCQFGSGFGLFCSGLSRLLASQALLEALVERWWETTNSFHFSSTGEMTMTPYDFSMITGLRVRGDLIPFDMDMGQWEAAWIHLLGAHPPLDKPTMVRYSWFYDHFHRSQPETQEEMEQYTRGFLIYLLSTTLFANRYMSSDSRKKGNKLWAYAYFLTLAPVPMHETAPTVPYSRRYDRKCHPRHRDDMTFTYYRRYFDIVTVREITWHPWAMMPAGIRDQYAES
ncbi:hypothetical protein ACSBR1_029798 [Camellia fascicularis]